MISFQAELTHSNAPKKNAKSLEVIGVGIQVFDGDDVTTSAFRISPKRSLFPGQLRFDPGMKMESTRDPQTA